MENAKQEDLLRRITSKPGIFGGRPIIRNMRFPVTDILEMMSSGMRPEEILEQHPSLEPDDIPAALLFAAFHINNKLNIHAA